MNRKIKQLQIQTTKANNKSKEEKYIWPKTRHPLQVRNPRSIAEHFRMHK